MTVGIIHNAYLLKGGEDAVVEQEYQLLKKNNVSVELLYFKNADNKFRQLVEFFIAVYNPFSYKYISRWIDKVKPDVIHLHNWHYRASPAIIKAAKKKGVPVVHTLHNFRLLCPSGTLLHKNKLSSEYLQGSFPWRAIWNRAYRNSSFQTFWLSFIIWFHKVSGTWNSIDRYIVLTDHAKSVYLSTGNFDSRKIMVKPNFINDIGEGGQPREAHFLYAGRLAEEKGIVTLLGAFAKSGLPLRIVGDGPLIKMVQQYADKYDNISYAGFKDKAGIIHELKACTALVFPSVWYEGNPIIIIEALACGTAIIASGMGAMQAMLTDGFNAVHFLPGSESSLVEKVTYWQSLPRVIKNRFYANARQTYIEKYTPATNFENLISIYKSVLINGKAKPAELVH